jgi:hypothetical protein
VIQVVARGADESRMDIRISLQYPNGRIHEATVERDRPLERGDEFELHGRNWRIVARTARTRRSVVTRETPVLCRTN